MRANRSRQSGSQGSIRAGGLVLAIALALGIAPTNANAQVLVTNPILQSANHSDFLAQLEKTISQYEKQIQQYELQLQQYQQMFINLKSLGNVMPSFNNQLQHLDANQLAQVECSSSNGTWSVGGIVQSVTSSFDKTYVEAQKEICAQVVTIQVDKYNKTADMMDRLNYYNSLAQQTDQSRTGISQDSGTGDLNSNTNQAARNLADLQTEIANWQSQMAADDSMLKTLQDMQSVLAEAALKGSQDMLGKGVQAAALAAALQVND